VQCWQFEYQQIPGSVKAGVVLGNSLKSIKYVSKAANLKGTTIQMYYVQGTTGTLKGKNFYVLVSQSNKKFSMEN